MLDYIKEYWYIFIFMAVALAVTVLIIRMAARAYTKRQRIMKAQEKEIKRLLELKEKFRPLTAEAIENASAEELLEGVALFYQLKIQKEENIEELFEQFNEDVKQMYALDVFLQDKTAKEFFSQNTDILCKRILPALEKIGMSELAAELKHIALMYDVTDETVSYDEKKIAAFDEKNLSEDILLQIRIKAAEYIKENPESFINS